LQLIYKQAQSVAFLPKETSPIGKDISIVADRALNINVIAMAIEHIMRIQGQLCFQSSSAIDALPKTFQRYNSKYLICNRSGFCAEYSFPGYSAGVCFSF
jgi:hypothetical protein